MVLKISLGEAFKSLIVYVIVCLSLGNALESSDNETEILQIENSTQQYESPPQPIIIEKPSADRNMLHLRDTVKTLNDQLQTFNSLYIRRLDQKLTSIMSSVVNIDSNVKHIQERAHVWDTFQLHVSAWNDQIKSLDRKVDIINSGQEKMALLESKLSILLNLEYNSARIVNKLATVEDKLEQIERTLKRQQVDISYITQKESSEVENGKNVPNIMKSLERKTDRLIGMVQRNTPLGRRFARGRNDSHTPQRILIKCTTPPIIEETVKDVASKVDLIYDKIISDNISNDDCNPDDEKKTDDSSGEIDDEIEQDYPLFVFNSDEQDSVENKFKRQTRDSKYKMLSRNTTRIRRSIDHDLQSEIDNFKSLLIEFPHHITTASRELSEQMQYISTNVDFIKNLLMSNLTKNKPADDIEVDIMELNNKLVTTCHHIQYKTGIQNEVKQYCRNVQCVLYRNVTLVSECFKVQDVSWKSEIDSTPSTPYDNSNEKDNKRDINNVFSGDFSHVCDKYLKSFDRKIISDIKDPEELTCFIVHSHKTNKSQEYCNDTTLRFCDENSFIIFQSRKSEVQSFAKSWKHYKWGFGDFISQNYWIGLEALHLLTQNSHPAILKVYMEDFDGYSAWAEYDRFNISSELDAYRIFLSGYRGNATNGLSYHNGAGFSTLDTRHDEAPECCPCSNSYGLGGWWYKSCFDSNLNGKYLHPPQGPKDGGVSWEPWRPDSTLSRTSMALGFLKPSTSDESDYEDP